MTSDLFIKVLLLFLLCSLGHYINLSIQYGGFNPFDWIGYDKMFFDVPLNCTGLLLFIDWVFNFNIIIKTKNRNETEI